MTADQVTDATPADLVPRCPFCGSPASSPCVTRSGEWARTTHAVRARLARVLAAHSDPALDAFFPKLGPCRLCETPGLDQRHRVIDAIAELLAAGESVEDLADDYDEPAEAIHAVLQWGMRWPGAWE